MQDSNYNWRPLDPNLFKGQGFGKEPFDGITISPKGWTYLTRITMSRLGNPTHLFVETDETKGSLLFRPVDANTPYALKVYPSAKGSGAAHLKAILHRVAPAGRYLYKEDYNGGIVLERLISF